MTEFAPWIKRFGPDATAVGAAEGAVLVFPHAGGAAAAYRKLAKELSTRGADTYLLQYPCRADRLAHPPAASIAELAAQLYAAGDWHAVAPLHLFGHCMGATVAFEFARLAEADDVAVDRIDVGAGGHRPDRPARRADRVARLHDAAARRRGARDGGRA